MDLSRHPSSPKKIAGQLKTVFGYFMVGVYLCIGLFLVIKGWVTLSEVQSISIGILLIIYAIFRIFRLSRKSGLADNAEGQDENH